jgi:hypothetical protein
MVLDNEGNCLLHNDDVVATSERQAGNERSVVVVAQVLLRRFWHMLLVDNVNALYHKEESPNFTIFFLVCRDQNWN